MIKNYFKTQTVLLNLKSLSNQLIIKQLCLVVALCLAICAQAQFTEQTGVNNPFDGFDVGSNSQPFFVDLDEDGDLDLITGEDQGTFLYYQNNGNNTFILQTGVNNPLNGIDSGDFASPSLIDLDEDGDLDLVTGGTDGTIKYYRNDLSAGFTQLLGADNPFDGIDVGSHSTPTLVDLDNDNDLDLISGNSSGTFPLYLNNGNNVFTEQPGASSPLFGLDAGIYSSPVLIDIDNDGDLDFVSGNSSGTFPLYLNDGSNIFTEQPGALSPLFGLDAGTFSQPVFVDLDNDSDMDLVSGNNIGTFRYYNNDGSLSTESFSLNDSPFSIYPNPAITTLHIEAQPALKQSIIYNLQRQKIIQSSSNTIDVSELSNGLYLIKVEDENGNISTKRFVKN